MRNKCQNIQVLFVNEITRTATVNFLDENVVMPISLDLLRDKINDGFYMPTA